MDLGWSTMTSSVEFFIQNVRDHECIWNKNNLSYRDGLKKDNAWDFIARECGMSNGREAKCRWKKLRDSYREAMRRRKPEAGPSAQYLGKWKYEEHMKFVSVQSGNREDFNDSYDTHENNSKNSTDNKNTFARIPINIDTSDSISNNDPLYVKPDNKRKRDSSYISDGKETLREIRERHRDDLLSQLVQNSRKNDALSKFFDSLCEKTRDLPKYLQLRVQREVFDSVSRAEEEALSLNTGDDSYDIVSKMSPQGYDESNPGPQSQYREHTEFEIKLDCKSIDSNDS